MSKEMNDPVKELFALTDTQIQELLKAVDDLWDSGDITIINTSKGFEVGMNVAKIDTVVISDLKSMDVRDAISSVLALVNLIVESESVTGLENIMNLSDEEKTKLNKLYPEFKKLKSLVEINFQASAISPILDIKAFQYSIKKVIDRKNEVPVVGMSFILSDGVKKDRVYFETTRTGLKNLAVKLRQAEKDLEALSVEK